MSDLGPLPPSEPIQPDADGLQSEVDNPLDSSDEEIPEVERGGPVGSAVIDLMSRFEQPDSKDGRSMYDGLNESYENDPEMSVLDNMYAAYDGKPPEAAVEFAIFLDAQRELLDKFERGEISAEEFTRLHDLASKTIIGQDEPPTPDPSNN